MLLFTAKEGDVPSNVPSNVPEDAPLELVNLVLRSKRGLPALVAVGAASWLAPPNLVGAAFFVAGGANDLSREVLNSVESVVLASLSIVLGTLVSTAVSVLRERQEKIRCSMLKEASLLDTLAQQLVKLFRYDKARLTRVTAILERYVEEKRQSIRKSTKYGYRDYYAHWDAQQKRSLAILDVVAECLDNQIAGPKYGFSPSSSTAAIYQCEILVFELNRVRQEYRSSLNASLPRGIFTTIVALMVAILYTFACRAAAMGSVDATRLFLSETVVRALFALTATSFFAILQVLSDLADTYTGANEQFRVDARILDGATFRIAGAKALAAGKEDFDDVLPGLADRPDMFLDDELAEGFERDALAKGDRESW